MKGSPVIKFVSIPLDEHPGATGKAEFSDRLLGAIESIFAAGTIGRVVAAGYLRSVDPVVLFAQSLAGMFGFRQAAYFAWEIRVRWRQLFEDKICAIMHTRILGSIDVVLDFYGDMGYLLPPRPKDVLYSRLVDALGEDGLLAAELAELQKLPIGRAAVQRRILALDAGVELHLAALMHEMVMVPSTTRWNGFRRCPVHG
jgi:hypothetical protein